ncbi:ribulose bisphosphate carboxylase small subunit, chloroplastic-like [Argentina anserina]|uniref:ribulose bisphosphate carboxylase small subunit, chloroplastic-like n=1 Tax=Argentina anserina TaxID=57926 RepID=UPI0021767D60|nr:ribulose bisphosphate carboxylase small subunit, chloroplastic-like [Potentilla anserina]
MASSMFSSAAAVATAASPAQASMVAPFTGLKSGAAFPVTRKTNADITSLPSNGGRVQCMKVWPTTGLKKFETLSYLPPLTAASLAKEVDYLLKNKWVPCLEFELEKGFVTRENHKSPGYYDGRYWTMWKLPMFGCTDSAQVLKELDEAIQTYPNAFIRIIGFDNVRQVQCISFIAYKPKGY